MASTITYKGEVITNVTNDTKKLLTKQKYCEDDITITDVTSEVVPTQTKSKTYTSNQTDTIYPDAGYNLSQVDITVNVPTGGDIESRVSRTYTSNGTYEIDPSEDYDGIEGADIVVNVPVGGDIQNSKTSSYTNNGTYHIYPDEGYDGVYDNTVTINVPAGGNVEPTRTVTYTTNGSRNITPTSGYDSIAGVNINVNVPNVLEYVPQETKTGVTNTAIEIDNFATIEQPNNQTLVEGTLTEVNSGGHGLPSEYQEVEYLENTANCYIDSGYSNTNGMKFDVEFSINQISTAVGSFNIVLGAESTSSPYGRQSISNTQNYLSVQAGGYGNLTSYIMETNKKYHIVYSTLQSERNTVLVNGETIPVTYGGDTTSRTSKNIYIFNRNNFISGAGLNGKIYYLKIYDNNNTIVREFYPCYVKATNEGGLYDIINNVFYGNNGSGSFTYGDPLDPKSPTNPSTITVPVIEGIYSSNFSSGINSELCAIDNIKDTIKYLHREVVSSSGGDINEDIFEVKNNIKHITFTGTGTESSCELEYYDTTINKFISNVGGTVSGNIITFSEAIPVGTVVHIYYVTYEPEINNYELENWIETSTDELNITTTDTTIQLPITFTYYKDWRI